MIIIERKFKQKSENIDKKEQRREETSKLTRNQTNDFSSNNKMSIEEDSKSISNPTNGVGPRERNDAIDNQASNNNNNNNNNNHNNREIPPSPPPAPPATPAEPVLVNGSSPTLEEMLDEEIDGSRFDTLYEQLNDFLAEQLNQPLENLDESVAEPSTQQLDEPARGVVWFQNYEDEPTYQGLNRPLDELLPAPLVHEPDDVIRQGTMAELMTAPSNEPLDQASNVPSHEVDEHPDTPMTDRAFDERLYNLLREWLDQQPHGSGPVEQPPQGPTQYWDEQSWNEHYRQHLNRVYFVDRGQNVEQRNQPQQPPQPPQPQQLNLQAQQGTQVRQRAEDDSDGEGSGDSDSVSDTESLGSKTSEGEPSRRRGGQGGRGGGRAGGRGGRAGGARAGPQGRARGGRGRQRARRA